MVPLWDCPRIWFGYVDIISRSSYGSCRGPWDITLLRHGSGHVDLAADPEMQRCWDMKLNIGILQRSPRYKLHRDAETWVLVGVVGWCWLVGSFVGWLVGWCWLVLAGVRWCWLVLVGVGWLASRQGPRLLLLAAWVEPGLHKLLNSSQHDYLQYKGCCLSFQRRHLRWRCWSRFLRQRPGPSLRVKTLISTWLLLANKGRRPFGNWSPRLWRWPEKSQKIGDDTTSNSFYPEHHLPTNGGNPIGSVGFATCRGPNGLGLARRRTANANNFHKRGTIKLYQQIPSEACTTYWQLELEALGAASNITKNQTRNDIQLFILSAICKQRAALQHVSYPTAWASPEQEFGGLLLPTIFAVWRS